MKKAAYVVWAWATTFAFGVLIVWLASIPNFDVTADATNEVVKVIFRMLLYSILFILFYRAIIATLKNTVSRLSAWRSKNEAIEDAEFVLIIETMAVIISILATILFAVFEEYMQGYVSGRSAEVKDVLISTMAVLLTALIVYSMPVLGELEMALKYKLDQRKVQLKTKSGKKKKN